MDLDARLDRLLDGYDARPDTGPVRWHLDGPGWSWSRAADQPYFAASITKLVTNALVLRLADQGLDLDQPAAGLLEPGTMRGLHVLDGVDRSGEITVRQLLAHTSGLADYFEGKRADGGTTIDRAVADDPGWDLAEVLAITRGMRPAFAPGAPGKALYSDTNYQLLGAIIERATGASYAEAVAAQVATPLGLTETWVFGPGDLDRYDALGPMLLGTKRPRLPRTMASVQADGGLVTTAAESARLLRAFLGGELFDAAHVARMQRTWRRIFYPLRYGEGVMLYQLPRWFTGFRTVPPLVGHSGASGAVLFHAADLDLVVAGTVNQLAKRPMPYQLMTKALLEVLKRP